MLEEGFDVFGAEEEVFHHVAPENLIPEAIDERAEETWDQNKAEVVEKGNVLPRPDCVQHYEALCDGASESQNAEQQLKAMQEHSVHGSPDREPVLPQLPRLQQNSHIGEEDDEGHHCKEEHTHGGSEQRLDERWVDGSGFAQHWGCEAQHGGVSALQGKLNDGKDEADKPQGHDHYPDTFWTPSGRALQGVEDGNVTLQRHCSQDQGGVLESGSGYNKQRDTEHHSKFHLSHDTEEEQHRGQDLQGVIDQHVSKQDITGSLHELPVRGKDVQHDNDAAEERAK